MEENNVREKYKEITEYLIENRLTVSTMESMTAGLIASLLTDTEGASAVLKGAYVTYSNEAKVKNGVPKETIETYGVYSEETALDMARACQRAYQADIGIGITGTAGNADCANKDSEIGKVCAAISFHKQKIRFSFHMTSLAQRSEYKLYAADKVAEQVLLLLKSSKSSFGVKGFQNKEK